jgi:hypothetical protein
MLPTGIEGSNSMLPICLDQLLAMSTSDEGTQNVTKT